MSTQFFGRTLARSQALQILFQAEQTDRMVSEVLAGEYVLSEGPLDAYAKQLACGTDGIRDALDAILRAYSREWSVSRMPSVDRNLLRLSLYEMLEVPDVDVAVTINEVVELARAYGGDESPRFINGILGRVAADMAEGKDIYEFARLAANSEESMAQEESSLQERNE